MCFSDMFYMFFCFVLPQKMRDMCFSHKFYMRFCFVLDPIRWIQDPGSRIMTNAGVRGGWWQVVAEKQLKDMRETHFPQQKTYKIYERTHNMLLDMSKQKNI